jgi:large subunit ribosomal protein L24
MVSMLRDRVEQPTTTAGLKKGDQVRVMTGRDRGKTGRVLAVNPSKRTITVEHAGIIKRHTRPNPSKNVKGGIVEKEGPMAISNVCCSASPATKARGWGTRCCRTAARNAFAAAAAIHWKSKPR